MLDMVKLRKDVLADIHVNGCEKEIVEEVAGKILLIQFDETEKTRRPRSVVGGTMRRRSSESLRRKSSAHSHTSSTSEITITGLLRFPEAEFGPRTRRRYPKLSTNSAKSRSSHQSTSLERGQTKNKDTATTNPSGTSANNTNMQTTIKRSSSAANGR